jgi:hypothetical protein
MMDDAEVLLSVSLHLVRRVTLEAKQYLKNGAGH